MVSRRLAPLEVTMTVLELEIKMISHFIAGLTPRLCSMVYQEHSLDFNTALSAALQAETRNQEQVDGE